jgi:ubiquinone/menaquinone biosynthesis C-methylase UbiE
VHTATCHAWDNAAEGWNHNAALIHAWLHDATQRMLDAAHIHAGSKVLDVAAGAGDQTLDIARRVGMHGSVLATDISATILELARRNAHAAGYFNVDTMQADAQTLGLASMGSKDVGSNFDAAVCRLGLMFCQTPLDALREINAVLKPGAYFSALVFAEPARNPCLRITLATARKHAGLPALPPDAYVAAGTLMSLGKRGALEALLSDAQFADVEVHAVSAPFKTPTVRRYVDFIKTSASPIIEILAPLTEAARQKAWEDIAEQLDVFTSHGGWIGPNELLLCSARKL